MTEILTGVAWGSILPQLSAFTAALTGDGRYAARVAAAAGRYVRLLQSYSNNASYDYPELLNVTSVVDSYNVGRQGWPASAYGDWCPANSPGQGCTSVSALLNSVYFILDCEAALSILRSAQGMSPDSTSGDGPSEAQLNRWLTVARKSFSELFLRHIIVYPHTPNNTAPRHPISGLAFRDVHPPNITHHGTQNNPPSAQVEAASGMAAMDSVLDGNCTERGALADMLAGLVENVSSVYSATQTGGVIDMAHLGPSLVNFGRPDAAFALLSTDGPTSLYHMAESTGTLWAHPGSADGDRGRCSSHNHIMQGGSVGEALFGIGGIRPSFVRGTRPEGGRAGQRLLIAPVPWLSDAPRGAAVWRTAAGEASASWAVSTGLSTGHWSGWVNVTVPAAGGGADVKVMVPRSAQSIGVCAWECGLVLPGKKPFTARWVSFDGGSTGRSVISAALPLVRMADSAEVPASCTPLWRQGSATAETISGIESVKWVASNPGSEMFPGLDVVAGSGSYAFYVESC